MPRRDRLNLTTYAHNCVFTSFSFSYLNRAFILFDTLKRYNHEVDFVAVITDRPPPNFDLNILNAFDRVIYSSDLDIADFPSWIFKHDVVEACTAVKGASFLKLFKLGYKKVVYLDPDTAVFSSLKPLFELLSTYSIILTPHQLEPNDKFVDIQKYELESLKFGIFNLGFVAASHSIDGIKFAEWWAKVLYSACYSEIENGLFTDQKWCDLVPVFFDNVHILKDPGYNVATWNLSRRKIRIDLDGAILVNERPFRFFHFTKMGREGDVLIQSFIDNNIEILEFFKWYKQKLLEPSHLNIPRNYWAYNNFENGEKIEKAYRVLFRNREDLRKAFPNPFCPLFYEWLQQNLDQLPDSVGLLFNPI